MGLDIRQIDYGCAEQSFTNTRAVDLPYVFSAGAVSRRGPHVRRYGSGKWQLIGKEVPGENSKNSQERVITTEYWATNTIDAELEKPQSFGAKFQPSQEIPPVLALAKHPV